MYIQNNWNTTFNKYYHVLFGSIAKRQHLTGWQDVICIFVSSQHSWFYVFTENYIKAITTKKQCYFCIKWSKTKVLKEQNNHQAQSKFCTFSNHVGKTEVSSLYVTNAGLFMDLEENQRKQRLKVVKYVVAYN